MGVLSRYLLVRFVVTFAAVLAILVLLVAVVELLADFGDVMRSAGGFAEAVVFVALRIPYKHLPLLIPVAAFAAAFLSVGTAARAYEILAMKAGGVSPLRALAPVLCAAAVISGLGLLVNETLAVRAHEAQRRRAAGEDSSLTFRRGSFWYHKGDTIYNVRDADPASRVLRDVAIFELDGRGRLVRSIEAATATIGDDGHWELADAVLREFTPGERGAAPRFQRVAAATLDRPQEAALLDADVGGLSIRELREYRAGREPGDTTTLRADVLLQERLTGPLASLLFVVLAIPLALRVEHTRSLAVPALQGVIAIFAFVMVREYGSTLAGQGVASAAATQWAILGAFLVVGAVELWRVPR